MRALQPSFDLDAAHSQLRQIVDQIVCGQVLRAEEIRFIAQIANLIVNDQFVRLTTRLRALAAIGAAAADRLARQTLSAVGDT